MNAFTRLIWSLSFTLLLAACVSTGKRVQTDADVVAERAQLRWQNVLAGDFASAYEYLSPAQKSISTLTDFQRKILTSPVRWTSARLEGVECRPDACTARFTIGATVVSPVRGVSKYELSDVVEEQWIRIRNDWWYVPN